MTGQGLRHRQEIYQLPLYSCSDQHDQTSTEQWQKLTAPSSLPSSLSMHTSSVRIHNRNEPGPPRSGPSGGESYSHHTQPISLQSTSHSIHPSFKLHLSTPQQPSPHLLLLHCREAATTWATQSSKLRSPAPAAPCLLVCCIICAVSRA